MFTGIIEETGTVRNVSRSGLSVVLEIEAKLVLEDAKIGDSISVNGVCLTITSMNSGAFTADVSYETVRKSSLANVKGGSPVNLERALTLNTRLGGHLVSGHVDGVGTFLRADKMGESYKVFIKYPSELDRYIADKGSVTIDGISLTVASHADSVMEIAVIPHTFENTVLKHKKGGDNVNLEADVVARYLEKLLKNNNNTTTLADKLSMLDID